jgi:glycosidase
LLKKMLTLIFFPFLLLYVLPVSTLAKGESNWQYGSIYSLNVDRFKDGNTSNNLKDVNKKDPLSYRGGDFQGIIDELDYIKNMGFKTVMLNSIFNYVPIKAKHTQTLDLSKPNDHYGTLAEFKKLVKEAHKRGIKIILELDVLSGPNHEIIHKTTKNNKLRFPNQNAASPISDDESRKSLLEGAKLWIQQTDIDGFLLTDANQSSVLFWREFSQEMKSVKSNFILLGELDSKDPAYIASFQDKAGFDGILNTPLNQPLRNAFSKPDVSIHPLFHMWDQEQKLFKNPSVLGAFFDNDQTTRFTRDMVKNKQYPVTRWELAITYLYTQPEIPVVYYGSEIAVDGGKSPDNQRVMNFRADETLIDYFKQMSGLRSKYPALSKGSMKVLAEEGGMSVYERHYKDQTMVIAINNTSKSQSVDLNVKEFAENTELHGELNGDLVRNNKGKFNIILDRESSEVYLVSKETGINYWFFAVLIAIWLGFFLFVKLVKNRGKKKPS